MSIRMRHTKGHTGNRRAHHALKGINIIKTDEGSLRLPHRVDEATGMYRGKQIAPAREARPVEPKVKGPDTEPTHDHPHEHEHAHIEHQNAEVKGSKGVTGKVATGGRPKARSGFGGGV
jgi:ribosomal protein L32